ncbi:hypothetical protein SPAN111604_04630 [Sphingomonas antarctica]|uniref:hypothetical protein n=1 Tax=Sphingomonas antarctica TaxID=2040274 RepID=UPI0039ED19E0
MTSKIDLRDILVAHWQTLTTENGQGIYVWDAVTFYALPVALGCVSSWQGWLFNAQIYYTSTSVFGIFAGLLLNVQIGLFNIHVRNWRSPDNTLYKKALADVENAKRVTLRQLNANVSYLIMIASVGVVMSLIYYALPTNRGIYTAILIALYSHFLLSFLMSVKRSYLLFAQEYEHES